MTGFPIDWVDAFTDRAFGGNGCAVVHEAGALSPETCTAFVRETSLVECTFVEPSAVADWRVRYFIAKAEIPFAGHPTLATATALADRGLVRAGAVRLETGAGIIPVEVPDGPRGPITMTQIAPRFGPQIDPSVVAAVVGLATADIVAPPQIVSTGLPFCVTLLSGAEALRRARIDPAGMRRFRAALGLEPAEVMEPYLVALGGMTDAGDTSARLLLEPPSPPEDPFTGSATGATAAWLWHHGHIPRPVYTAEQGHWMGRPGSARVEVLGPPDAITGVRLSGRAHVLMRGTLEL